MRPEGKGGVPGGSAQRCWPPPQSSQRSAASVGAARPQSSEPVTVRWFVGLGTGTEPEQIDAQEAVVEEFNASQDAIDLEVEIVDNTDAFDGIGHTDRRR